MGSLDINMQQCYRRLEQIQPTSESDIGVRGPNSEAGVDRNQGQHIKAGEIHPSWEVISFALLVQLSCAAIPPVS